MSDSSTRDDRIAAGCLQVIGFVVFGLMTLASILPDSGPDYSSSANDITWETYDITIDVREDGSMHITEYQEIEFDGNYSSGFVEIPMERIEAIDNVSVTLERGVPGDTDIGSYQLDDEPEGALEEAEPVSWGAFDDSPNTFRARQEGQLFLIDYAFDPVSRWSLDYTNDTRTVIIEYDVYGVIRDYPDVAEPWQQFHWQAISDEVTEIAPIEHASVTVNLPESIAAEDLVVAPVAESNDGRTITWTRTGMDEGDSFDVQAAFPTITEATAPEWQPTADARDTSIEEREQRQNAGQLMLILAGIGILVLGGLTLLYAWYRGIREPTIGPVHDEVAELPRELPAVLVGSLMDEQVDPRDIAAGVLDLDRQGFITIRNGEERERENYYLTLTRPIPVRPAWAREILVTIFGERAREGDTEGFSALAPLFGERRQRLQHAIDQTLVDDGYYEELPETSRKHWTWVTYAFAAAGVIAAIAILIWVRGWTWWALVPPIPGFVLYWFGQKLTPHVAQKTHKGAEVASLWRAFENHLRSTRDWRAPGLLEQQRVDYAPWLLALGIEQGWLSEMNRPSWTRPVGRADRSPGPGWGDWGPPRPRTSPTSTRSGSSGSGSGRTLVHPSSWRPTSPGWDAGNWRDMQSASEGVGERLSSMSESTFSMIGDMLESIGSSSGGGGSSGGGSSFRGSSSRSGGGRSRSSSGGGRRGFR